MPWFLAPVMLPAVLLAIADDEERRFMAEVYLHHHRLMRYTARKYMPVEADAEDVVSDALVALYGRIDTLRQLEEKPLRAYIVRTVRNTALNALVVQRRMLQRTADSGDALCDLPGSADVEGQLLLAEELRRVLTAIHALPQKEQDVLWLRIAQGRTNEEIAAATGLSPESIRKYISRARARLRTAVYGEGAGS